MKYRFKKELYSKSALLKASYNFTDIAFIHLDADDDYYIVDIELKSEGATVKEKDFVNELLAQSVRHEIYLQTKNIRELMFARAMATTVVTNHSLEDISPRLADTYTEDEILKDWFSEK